MSLRRGPKTAALKWRIFLETPRGPGLPQKWLRAEKLFSERCCLCRVQPHCCGGGGDTHTEDPENSLALFSSEHDLENCNPDSHGQIKQSGPAAVIAPPPFKRRITGDSFPFLTPLCEVTPEKINFRAACLKMSSKKKTKKQTRVMRSLAVIQHVETISTKLQTGSFAAPQTEEL